MGGDINPSTGNTDFNLGISPYLQARLHLYGDADGRGLQLGTAAVYKFVGFEGDPGEVELAVSAQYRQRLYELGLQGNLGQDFGDSSNHDGEVHAYALVRPIPQLGLGGAGQVRIAIAPPVGDPNAAPSHYDVVGGGMASVTLSKYQLAALAGVSFHRAHAGQHRRPRTAVRDRAILGGHLGGTPFPRCLSRGTRPSCECSPCASSSSF